MMDKVKIIGRLENLLFYICGLTNEEAVCILEMELVKMRKKSPRAEKELYKKMCDKYDAYFDERDGSWIEKRCPDPKCNFCSKRPEMHKPHKWEHIDRTKFICK